MKLKKVASLCKKSKSFILFVRTGDDGNVTQWPGNGHALYPITGLPYTEPENICSMFDITEKQKEKTHFRHTDVPATLYPEDSDPDERKLETDGISIIYGGNTLIPLQTRQGIVFIQNKYLSPLDDGRDCLGLYERTATDGTTYIVAKTGFLLSAVIMPSDALTADMVKNLDRLTAQCRLTLEARNRQKAD